jgi:hypothetical protein
MKIIQKILTLKNMGLYLFGILLLVACERSISEIGVVRQTEEARHQDHADVSVNSVIQLFDGHLCGGSYDNIRIWNTATGHAIFGIQHARVYSLGILVP